MRMFAGPNGSGKSTLKTLLPPALLGIYLNPDDIEQQIRMKGSLDLSARMVATEADEVLAFFTDSPLLRRAGLSGEARRLAFAHGLLSFAEVPVSSYYASVAVDFIRQKLLQKKISFTFETVMSHPGKVELLEQAQRLGYRTYLYYVATNDPEINLGRVRYRVSQGGHDVPEDKIRSRYYRSLDLLVEAIRHTNRAYIWDNSGTGQEKTLLAEITDGRDLVMKSELMPAWFKKAVMDKIHPS
jgi:predicted ABC-type ATPase